MKAYSNGEIDAINQLNRSGRLFKEPLIVALGAYDAFDAENNDNIVESKRRNFTSNHFFAQEGVIIERSKYNDLMTIAENNNKRALYCNIFTDSKVFIWNLSEMTANNHKFKWFEKNMNRKTFESEDKTDKSVALLQLSDSAVESTVSGDLRLSI